MGVFLGFSGWIEGGGRGLVFYCIYLLNYWEHKYDYLKCLLVSFVECCHQLYAADLEDSVGGKCWLLLVHVDGECGVCGCVDFQVKY